MSIDQGNWAEVEEGRGESRGLQVELKWAVHVRLGLLVPNDTLDMISCQDAHNYRIYLKMVVTLDGPASLPIVTESLEVDD